MRLSDKSYRTLKDTPRMIYYAVWGELATFVAELKPVKTSNQISPSTKGDKDSKTYPIMESFYTIQGEGFNSGTAAYFIRLGGCDVGCHWCDVKESWPATDHPLTSIDSILKEIGKYNVKNVVITGGEPLMYDMGPLTDALHKERYKVFLETSGAYPISGVWHWICLSPKKFKLPAEGWHASADELKVVIFNKSDFEFAEEHANKVGSNCQLYLQPEWDKRDKMMPEIVDYVKKNPKWKISLQSHKYLGIP